MNIFNPTIQYLNKLQIKYVLSGPALYGLVHNNNINQYRQLFFTNLLSFLKISIKYCYIINTK